MVTEHKEEQLKGLFQQYLAVVKNINEVTSTEEKPWAGDPLRLVFRLHEKASSLLREMHEVAYLT